MLKTLSDDTPTRTASSIIIEDDLNGLPQPVQRYLRYSGVIGKPWIETVHLQYSGKFRMAPDKGWMALDASQFYTTASPGFLWKAQFKLLGVPFMFATDTYKDGHSHMFGKVAGLMTVVDGKGEEVDQGTMVRYLQEMSWFPTAYLGDNIEWQAVDDHVADVSLHDHGKSVSARMYFDDAGRLLNFVAERYGEFEGKFAMKTWSTPMTEYAPMAGMMLPIGGMGVWQLPEGDFSYIDVHVKQIEYNQPIEIF